MRSNPLALAAFSQRMLCMLRPPPFPPLQVNQAMKLGVPVVATPLAMEGMHAADGQDCLLASDPAQFAVQVAKVGARPCASVFARCYFLQF